MTIPPLWTKGIRRGTVAGAGPDETTLVKVDASGFILDATGFAWRRINRRVLATDAAIINGMIHRFLPNDVLL